MGSILYNGKSGLIDKNLVKSQKVLEAYGFTYLLKDYGIVFFQARPLQGQTLVQTKDLILKEIEKLKTGDFDSDLIQATVNNVKVGRVREQENAIQNGYALNNQYSVEQSREDYLKGLDLMSKITKAEIMAFANKWFGDNYTVVYKKTGEDKNTEKVEKPEIHPVDVNRDAVTDFCKRIIETPTAPLKPVFVDFDKDILKKNLKKDLPIWYVPNKINNLFSAYYVLDMGALNNKKLPLAIDYIQLIGSNKMSNQQFNKELYKLAVDMNISSSDDQVYISLSGLEENFDKALALLEDLLNNPKPDQGALDKMIAAKIKGREDAVLNKDEIFWNALDNYTSYGAKNPFNDVLSNSDLRAIRAKELTDIIQSLSSYKHKIYYYGPRDFEKVAATFKSKHKTPSSLKDYPKPMEYTKNVSKENTVYFVNYDMVQAEVVMQSWDKKFDAKDMTPVRAFNEYYGGNMSSVVFQDIRESKALAYSAYSNYREPRKKEDPYKAFFYVGTQADKLPDAMKAMTNLLNEMPKSEKMWENGKRSIKTGIEARRVTKSQILFSYQNALRLGLDHDPRKDLYTQIDGVGLKDIERFHTDHFKNKPWQIRVLGSKDKVNIEDLKKYGKVVELSLKDVFGYEIEEKVIKP
jgi:predicted Zn-dependent peptidase